MDTTSKESSFRISAFNMCITFHASIPRLGVPPTIIFKLVPEDVHKDIHFSITCSSVFYCLKKEMNKQ